MELILNPEPMAVPTPKPKRVYKKKEKARELVGAKPTSGTPPVQDAINQLDSEVNRLDKAVSVLVDRLRTVSAPFNDPVGSANSLPVSERLSTTINMRCNQITANAVRLELLAASLEI